MTTCITLMVNHKLIYIYCIVIVSKRTVEKYRIMKTVGKALFAHFLATNKQRLSRQTFGVVINTIKVKSVEFSFVGGFATKYAIHNETTHINNFVRNRKQYDLTKVTLICDVCEKKSDLQRHWFPNCKFYCS